MPIHNVSGSSEPFRGLPDSQGSPDSIEEHSPCTYHVRGRDTARPATLGYHRGGWAVVVLRVVALGAWLANSWTNLVAGFANGYL